MRAGHGHPAWPFPLSLRQGRIPGALWVWWRLGSGPLATLQSVHPDVVLGVARLRVQQGVEINDDAREGGDLNNTASVRLFRVGPVRSLR
jgi:hypothetical protein